MQFANDMSCVESHQLHSAKVAVFFSLVMDDFNCNVWDTLKGERVGVLTLLVNIESWY